MKKFFVLFLFCSVTLHIFGQYVQRRVPVRSNLDAFQKSLNKIDEQADVAMAYRNGIEKYYAELITKNELPSDVQETLKQMKDESLKRIDDKVTYEDYSKAVETAEYEYKTVTVAMANVVKNFFEERNEYFRREQMRIYGNTHPFDNMSYSSYSRVVNNPTYETSSMVQITKVALSSQETRVEFKLKNRTANGYVGWVSIDPATYIYIPATKQKFKMRDALNIAKAPLKTEFHFIDEELVFALVFPALPSNTRVFSIIESENSDWKFNNIRIR